MSEVLEVLFCCGGDDSQKSCAAWDFRTGTNLMTYKGGGNVQRHSLSVLRAEYVLAANNAKPLLHVWPINAQEQISAVRFVVPGRVNAMAISPDGLYLVAGIQESLYIWHLTTGRMLNTIAKHYQHVTCVRFTDDGSHFVSAGQDGGVLVWNLTQVVSRGDNNQTPLYSFTDHGLPVTDIWVGAGGMRAYMISVSLDRTCKIYDLSCGALLLSVVFGEALQCVVANALETCVYVGTGEGNIYEFRLDAAPRTKEYHMERDHTNRFIGHKTDSAVNCLALSLDSQTLVSGGQDEQVCVWHIPSRQLLRAMPQKSAVTNLLLRLTNPIIFHPEHKQPHVFSGNLRRMLDPPEVDEEQAIEVLITEQEQTAPTSELPSHGVNWQYSSASAGSSNGTASSKNTTDELEKLRAEVQQLRSVNKKLFEISTKQLLLTPKTPKKKQKK